MERRAVTVQGIVQGVGFRPFVYGLAQSLGLAGFVQNQAGRVVIEVEGETASLDLFLKRLELDPPPLARIEAVAWRAQPLRHDLNFRIEPSDAAAQSAIFISPDVATCDACVAELFDPSDRRHGYPFLNCTHCGPRLTIIEGAPYDRVRTTMASFEMCAACRAEYEDPANRRFHAQPTACADCGPRLALTTSHGAPIETADPVAFFVDALDRGRVGAMKGLGGFHLVCDATNQDAVAELRRRKGRDAKPFAVMVADLTAAGRVCEINAEEEALLTSPRRPIVLLQKRRGPAGSVGLCVAADRIADAVAPGNPHLGLMLPYTPLHHLVMRAAGRPLVMTSGNRSDEPIAYENEEAISRLGSIADLFLTHDRPIHVRCDDSLTRMFDGRESPIRRSRGYAPEPLALPLACPCPILAVGGQLKGVFALGQERRAFLSHHMGDLDHWDAYQAFVRDIGLYEGLFKSRPQVVVHDLHPDYASTNYARERAARDGLKLIPVQHHHAHLASCMAEHGLRETVIGVSFDGTGLGSDGAIWGGEFLVGDYVRFRRAAHLRYVGMPGGEKAIREPWRMAIAHLRDADCPRSLLDTRIARQSLRTIETMLARGFRSPLTSSAGRLFDAVAALAGICDTVGFEGHAAQQLEGLATDSPPDGSYPFEIVESAGPSVIDTRPMIRAILQDVNCGLDVRRIARRFHSTVVEMITQTCCAIREQTRLAAVVLSGGVFLNAILARESAQGLREAGFRVYQHHLVPPGDGGLSLGQLAIAAATLLTVDEASSPAFVQDGAASESIRSLSACQINQEEQAHVPRHSG